MGVAGSERQPCKGDEWCPRKEKVVEEGIYAENRRMTLAMTVTYQIEGSWKQRMVKLTV